MQPFTQQTDPQDLTELGFHSDPDIRNRELESIFCEDYLTSRRLNDTFQAFLSRRVRNTNTHSRAHLPYNLQQTTKRRHIAYTSEYNRIYHKGIGKAGHIKSNPPPRGKPTF